MKGLMKDREKNKFSLRNSKATMTLTRNQLAIQTKIYNELQIQFNRNDKMIDTIQARMDTDVTEVIEKNAAKTKLLEGDFQILAQKVSERESHLTDIVSSSGMNISEMQNISSKLGQLLMEKNSKIELLQHLLSQATNDHYDVIGERCEVSNSTKDERFTRA